jgi:hypothetical protein
VRKEERSGGAHLHLEALPHDGSRIGVEHDGHLVPGTPASRTRNTAAANDPIPPPTRYTFESADALMTATSYAVATLLAPKRKQNRTTARRLQQQARERAARGAIATIGALVALSPSLNGHKRAGS